MVASSIIIDSQKVRELNIPYELFEDGQALLKIDFEDIVTKQLAEQSLQNNRLNTASSPIHQRTPILERAKNQSTGQDYTSEELSLISFFRELCSGSKTISLSSSTVNRIKEAMKIIGVDDESHLSFLSFVRLTRRKYGTENAEGENDKEEQKG